MVKRSETMVYDAPAGRASRPRPRARGTVALALVGLLVVIAGGFVVPWFGDWPEGRWHEDAAQTLYQALFFGAQAVILFPSILVAFAGALDSLVFRILYTVVGVLCGLLVGAVGVWLGYMATSAAEDPSAERSPGGSSLSDGATAVVMVVVAVVMIAWAVVFAFLRRLACRIAAGVMLLVAMGATVALVVRYSPSSAGTAGLLVASFGYLLCAIAAFAGPRYERVPAAAPPPIADDLAMLPPGRL